uniref:Uncharacterized protein n=1 Tax=Eutreptiella gymnastica TaxID=73025 RepID=A0A7S4CUP9_9EUGL
MMTNMQTILKQAAGITHLSQLRLCFGLNPITFLARLARQHRGTRHSTSSCVLHRDVKQQSLGAAMGLFLICFEWPAVPSVEGAQVMRIIPAHLPYPSFARWLLRFPPCSASGLCSSPYHMKDAAFDVSSSTTTRCCQTEQYDMLYSLSLVA